MKTPEKILSEHTGEEGIYLTHGLIRGSDALDAMDEYGIQQYNQAIKEAVEPHTKLVKEKILKLLKK